MMQGFANNLLTSSLASSLGMECPTEAAATTEAPPHGAAQYAAHSATRCTPAPLSSCHVCSTAGTIAASSPGGPSTAASLLLRPTARLQLGA
ncbi:hypothetical protein CHLRE_09g408626v5 [Chlamydomonas reinhardtii]|uniref:Uncharacterized protein n=1 Tax=Chlamydomonas reinhardtii TaxID=3055 RepID=A0A2K3DFG3_CHLRE|nr:uncharacterized protein CHLRE_09g408626v5 [Chlamydomonas reinhardtii]PNW79269.1 hypothetical protein CHLRE_09g408626v5 [Chlamydomonas reinhardtii]